GSEEAARGVGGAAADGPRRGAVGLPLAAARSLRHRQLDRVDAASRRAHLDVRGEAGPIAAGATGRGYRVDQAGVGDTSPDGSSDDASPSSVSSAPAGSSSAPASGGRLAFAASISFSLPGSLRSDISSTIRSYQTSHCMVSSLPLQ